MQMLITHVPQVYEADEDCTFTPLTDKASSKSANI